MEEEKKTEELALSGEQSTDGAEQTDAVAEPVETPVAAPAQQSADQDAGVNAEQPTAPAEQTDLHPTEQPTGSAEQAAEPVAAAMPPVTEGPVTDWGFGGNTIEKKKHKSGGQKQFFIMFGVIFGICMLLLCLTLLLGDGFQIVRNITKERIIYVRNDDGSSGLLTPEEAADKVKKSTVTVSVTTKTGSGIGSGFVYSSDGYICTNYHVVQEAVTVQVVLPDGRAVDATVRGFNEAADVAVLKIEAEGLIPVELGSSDDLLVGDAVVAIGTPAKLDYAGTSTFGTVSATNRLVQMSDAVTGTVGKKMTLIQTDTSVNPGNSGGPLADMYGCVVGVGVMKVSNYGGSDFEGIGFALPIDGVRMIVDEIIQKGTFTGRNPISEGRSLLGVTGHGGTAGYWYYVDPTTGTVTASETAQEGYHQMPVSGIYVMEVNGVNAQGKVQVGDVITRVNGLAVMSTTDLIGAVNRYYAGETVTLTLRRGSETVYVEVMLIEENAS